MSDRLLIIEQSSGNPSNSEHGVQLVADGDSGTWRLFLTPSLGCVDFSTAALKQFTEALAVAISDAERDPEGSDPERWAKWDEA